MVAERSRSSDAMRANSRYERACVCFATANHCVQIGLFCIDQDDMPAIATELMGLPWPGAKGLVSRRLCR